MNPTTFSFPTITLFGPGVLAELPGRLAGLGIRRPLLVTDEGLIGTSAFRALAAVLGEVERDHSWFVYSRVHSNPIEDDVREAAAMFRTHGCDGVIAIGRSEEHTSELQSPCNLVCRLLLAKKTCSS